MQTVIKAVIILFLISSLSISQVDNRKYNAYSGTLIFTVDGGTTIGLTDYSKIKPDYLGKVSLEYFLPAYSKSSFGIRIFGAGGYIAGQDNTLVPTEFRTRLSMIGGGVVYSIEASGAVFPYFFAGASYLWFDPMGPGGIKLDYKIPKKTEVNYNGELGFRFLLTNNFSVNLSGGAQLSPNDYLDATIRGTNNDMFYYASLGFSFSFFSDYDSDGDGVPDSKDICPDTPKGLAVDEFGCPIDSDHDGVPDYLDKCPNTPKGVPVDKNGCPLDSDGDGVPDYMDVCPDTPKGVKVDDLGCPLDSDGDGVPDYKDKCPDTPTGVQVDSEGCPIDSDHDGVPDYLDKCPATPAGVKVDSTGCPVKEVIKEKAREVPEESNKITLSSGATFAFGKSALLPSAFNDLDKIIKTMKEVPESRWLIAGYTDNIGSDNINKKVSLARAKAVEEYLVANGINIYRLKIAGYGKANPVASNATEEGRAINRRVEITRIR